MPHSLAPTGQEWRRSGSWPSARCSPPASSACCACVSGAGPSSPPAACCSPPATSSTSRGFTLASSWSAASLCSCSSSTSSSRRLASACVRQSPILERSVLKGCGFSRAFNTPLNIWASARRVYSANRAPHRRRYNLIQMTPPTAEALNSDLVQIDLAPQRPVRKPEWLKARAPGGETFHNLKKLARDLNLHTVCESAHCPNL